ncbi:MAG: TolC family protein, partial [Proteobacteria bacterium]|nr:TolC family protein [Pseudomonadota bacterium]
MDHTPKASLKKSPSSLTWVLLGLSLFFSLLDSKLQAKTSLSWQEAVLEAAHNNLELKAAAERLEAARAQVMLARSNFSPQIAANFTSTLAAENTNLVPKNNQTRDSYSAAITATQTLFDGFQTRAKIKLSQANVNESELSLKSLKARVSFDLKSAFAGMIQAQSSLKLYQEIIQRRQDNLRLVELRFQSGRENKGAVLLSESYLKQAQFEELQAKNNLSVMRSQLNKVLGRGDDTSYQLTSEMTLNPATAGIDASALARSTPDYQISISQEEAASADLSLAEAGYYPSLGLQGSLGRQGDDFFPKNDRWSISLNLTVPIYSGGHDSYARLAAIKKLTAAGLSRDSSEGDLVSKIRQAHVGFIEAIERLKLDESFQKAV